jgi:hypothetical protein
VQPKFRDILAVTAFAAVFLSSVQAGANGRFPRAERLVEAPNDANSLVLAATYGLVVTADRGATWHYVCEGSFAHMAIFGGDPLVDFAGDESLVVGAQISMSVSSDRGCNWLKTLGAGDEFIVDHAVSKSSPSTIVAAVIVPTPDAVANTIRESHDSGRTWNNVGTQVPLTAMYTLDLDPLDPRHVYVSGISNDAGVLAVSTDLGSTWSVHPILDTGPDEVPFIAGIHPTDPNRIFVRTDSARQDGSERAGDALLYSGDGGISWQRLHRSQAKLLGFALSPDGSRVLLGYGDPAAGDLPGPVGMFESSTSDFSFEHVYGGHVNCLTWTTTGLYVCSDETRDGFELGFSPSSEMGTDASCLVPLLHRGEVVGPLACDPSTTTGALCQNDWPSSCMRLGACGSDASPAPKTCVAFMPQGDAAVGGGGGGSSSTGDLDGGTNDGKTDGPADAEGNAAVEAAGGGCACRALGPARRAPDASAISVALSLGLLARTRKARSRSKSGEKRSRPRELSSREHS